MIDFVAGFLPSERNLITLAALAAVLAALLWLGRGVAGWRSGADGPIAPEIALACGWGATAGFLTLLGVAAGLVGLPNVFLFGAAILALLAFGILFRRVDARDVRTIVPLVKVLLLALPVLTIAAGRRPSEVDSFTHWLPNLLHLHQTGGFPTGDAPAVMSTYPAFPYHAQMIGYLVDLLTPFYASTSLILLNAMLIAFVALACARLIAEGVATGDDPQAATDADALKIRWPVAATGLLAVTALNPSFVPNVVLTSYGDYATAVLLALAAVTGGRLAGGGRMIAAELRLTLQLALILIALIGIKQSNLVLVLLVTGAAVIAALVADGRFADRRRLALRVVQAAVPALVVYGLWRFHVAVHLTGGENALLPYDQWQWENLPTILRNMGGISLSKSGHSILMLAAVGMALWHVVGRVRGRTGSGPGRLALVGALIFLGYQVFLALIYVAHFQGSASTGVQSYWRFNTQLGPLAVLVVAYGAAWGWGRRGLHAPAWLRRTPIVLALIGPLLLAEYMRWDLKRDDPFYWRMGDEMAADLPRGAGVALVHPRDNGNAVTLMQAILQLGEGRSDLTTQTWTTLPDDLTDRLESIGIGHAWLYCLPPAAASRFGVEPQTGAVLLQRTGGAGWTVLRRWAYPPVRLQLMPSRKPFEAHGCGTDGSDPG